MLILALWTLFFLGALALAVGSRVSGSLRLAHAMKVNMTAYALARAGAERAVMEIMINSTNWDGVRDEDLTTDPDLFEDNASLDGTVDGKVQPLDCEYQEQPQQALPEGYATTGRYPRSGDISGFLHRAPP